MKLNVKRTVLLGLAFMAISAFWGLYDFAVPLILKNTYALGETVTGVVMAMEFALEKKISAIEFMPMDVCYLLMAGGCALMIGCIVPHWRRAFGKKA